MESGYDTLDLSEVPLFVQNIMLERFTMSQIFLFFQESGSVYLQFLCSTGLQLEVIFEVLEEFDWTAFSVVTTRHHGYEDFLAMVEGMIDGSFIGWERKSVVMLNLTDDPGGARTRRLLKENEAQVRSGNINAVKTETTSTNASILNPFVILIHFIYKLYYQHKHFRMS